jgi:glutamine amidotransferase
MITLVNYGLGNIRAFVNIYKRLNIPVTVAQTRDELAGAQKIILPGVGAFDYAMSCLNDSGMRPELDALVLEKKVPVLGVCVGMQMMAQRSDEGNQPGLGWIDGEVKRFDESRFCQRTHLPHMGWNDVTPLRTDTIFYDLPAPRFYFLHSFHFVTKVSENNLSMSDYGGTFVSGVQADNVFGTQFHPEKSHGWGVQLLRNFAEI